MLQPFDDNYYMKKAFEQASLAMEKNEIPIGAILVSNNQIIAQAHNQTELLKDATAHAEMLCITAGMENIGAKYLQDCVLYVTLEPCSMCAGAIQHSHVKKIVFGAFDSKNGFTNYTPSLVSKKVEVIGGIMEKECSQIIKSFFDSKR